MLDLKSGWIHCKQVMKLTLVNSSVDPCEIYEIKQLSRVKQVKWKTLKRAKLIKQNEYIYIYIIYIYIYEFVTNSN